MSDRVFIDTNLLVYLYSESEKQKLMIACNLVDSHNCVISTQALNEASNVWAKKFGWNGSKIKQHLDNIEQVCDDVVLIQRNTIDLALDLKDRYKYSFFDSLMLASALENNCSTFFSEDFHDGQIIDDKIDIINPFK